MPTFTNFPAKPYSKGNTAYLCHMNAMDGPSNVELGMVYKRDFMLWRLAKMKTWSASKSDN